MRTPERDGWLLCVLSGGQTGVDRAALDAALEAGVPCAGSCPAGRWAEDGPIAARYPLRETASADPAARTCRNVRDADATLVLIRGGTPRGGTALAVGAALRSGRPVLCLDPESADPSVVVRWARARGIRRLNVAGPRESEAPGIYAAALEFLRRLLDDGRTDVPRRGGPPAGPHA